MSFLGMRLQDAGMLVWTLFVFMVCGGGVGQPVLADSQRAAMRARLALLQVHTVRSADGYIYVSGAEVSRNADLLAAAESLRGSLESLLGEEIPFAGQTLRLQVVETEESDGTGSTVWYEPQWSARELIHRIRLLGYDAVFAREARQATLHALLATYGNRGLAAGSGVFAVPEWFVSGVSEVLEPVNRVVVVEEAQRRWHDGDLPTLQYALAHPEILVADSNYGGVVVLWLLALDVRLPLLDSLWTLWWEGQDVSESWLKGYAGDDPDESFDRWLLRQRRTVRGLGAVTQAHIRQLRSALLLYPGRDGIPLSVSFGSGSDLRVLERYRGREWFDDSLWHLQQRLEALRPGRPRVYRNLVDGYVAVLTRIGQGDDLSQIDQKWRGLDVDTQALSDMIEAAGGVWQPSADDDLVLEGGG